MEEKRTVERKSQSRPSGSTRSGVRKDGTRTSHGGRRSRKSLARAKRVRKLRIMVGMAAMFVVLILSVITVSAIGKSRHVEINLKADNLSMIQEEAVPELSVTVDCEEGKEDMRLSRKPEYRVSDLIGELNSGEGYTISCDSDGVTEGTYPIELKLSDELKKKIADQWDDRVTIQLTGGELEVKNKTGEWDGDKFKRWDGSYVTSDFVDYKGATYYFDENGVKVTGEKKAGFYKCVFDEDGKLVSRESVVNPDLPMMALTFDDGPGERTAELLAVLEQYDAHATFFMQGINIPGNEEIVKKMEEIGCELGNHSYDHPQLSTLDPAGIQKQLGDTDSLIEAACGKRSTVLRPPYGDINDTVKASVGMPMILWNIDTLDWKTRDTQATIDCVLNTADDGDIILMHDIHSASVDAAIQLIPKLIENGYQLVTVSEMAEARGLTMENGVAYTDFNK